MKTILLISTLCALGANLPAAADTGAETASGPVSASAPDAWSPQDGDTIKFDVYRKGKKGFGTHTVSFDVEEDGTFTATSDVSLKAGLGPITLFRYKLDAIESWKDGKLVAVEGETNDDGTDRFVAAEAAGNAIQVNGSAYEGQAPSGIIPSSHWNINEVFSSRILSTETGEILDVEVEKIGKETVRAGGQDVEATHYRLVSDLTVDLWYDEQNRWVKLSFTARDQKIDYVLTELY
ncbi:DUF6134 family protein [Henriciella aquimarina]|uniref:DUF6134 family protein n=1 Tax=Henriciella aquimarina TaxID=545261 RepID=UPI000A01727B|nr:DUF6134 family protein [Henriciella aquimarina]